MGRGGSGVGYWLQKFGDGFWKGGGWKARRLQGRFDIDLEHWMGFVSKMNMIYPSLSLYLTACHHLPLLQHEKASDSNNTIYGMSS
jgi:hypothetical protein